MRACLRWEALAWLPLLALFAASAAPAQESVPARLAPWLDGAAEVRLARAFVPSPARRVGEVRILRRGEATVVETLLYTKVLARVVSEIRKKELANWPDDRDAQRYVAALARVREQIWERVPKNQRRADRRQRLWIDFVVAPGAAFVAIGAFEMDEAGGEIRVTQREPLAFLEPDPAWVRANQRLIAADAFHAEGAALAALFEKPAEPAPPIR